MRLGVDTYSLRWQGWNPHQFLSYAASLGLDVVQFSSRGNFPTIDTDYLGTVKRQADDLGLAIEVGMGSFDRFSSSFDPKDGGSEQQLAAMLRVADTLGSPIVRCFLGGRADRSGPMPIAQHIDECIRTIRAVGPIARDLGVRIAVENHGGVDLLARELKELVEAAGKEIAGVCLDTGNPAYAGEDPVLTVEVLAPYALTTHVRDTRIWATPVGAKAQWAPIGQGNVDIARILAILDAQAPGVPIDLEIITGSEPVAVPYLDSASPFWDDYPAMLARDFARFVVLARNGRPEPLEQLTFSSSGSAGLPVGQEDAFRQQQRAHFEESVRYVKTTLSSPG